MQLASRFDLARRLVSTCAAIALLAGLSIEASAKFSIATSLAVETDASMAFNSQTQQLWVAYLEGTTVRVRRYSEAGVFVGESDPFAGSVVGALTRPAIIYSAVSNQMLVAAVAQTTIGPAFVFVRRLDAAGVPLGTIDAVVGADDYYPGAAGNDHAGLRLSHNPSSDQVVVTVQMVSKGANVVLGARYDLGGVSATVGTVVGSYRELFNNGVSGFESHGVAYSAATGRYLFVVRGEARLLDASLDPQQVTIVGQPFASEILPLQWGEPGGGFGQFDVAWGPIEGHPRFLIVWSDADNCLPQFGSSCPALNQQASGVWGTFVDDTDLVFGNAENTPFPVTGGPIVHVGNRFEYTPRAAYDPLAQAFLVTWRELPFLDAINVESRSHIRAAAITRFVPENMAGVDLDGIPPKNYVISAVSGSCTLGVPCLSEEDPMQPDVVPLSGQAAALAWHERYPPNPTDLDVYGEIFMPDAPVNDSFANATAVAESQSSESTLIYATRDGSASCDSGVLSPDVWFAFTAPSAGVLSVSTCGTHDVINLDVGVDTVLSLHDASGTEFAGACNDDWISSAATLSCAGADAGIPRDSSLDSPLLTSGQTVYVRVANFEDRTRGHTILNTAFASVDIDDDGVFDEAEIASGCMNPNEPDSDSDDLDDGEEDLNGNGQVDAGETNPCVEDSDGDGLLDGDEVNRYGTDPRLFDSDRDGFSDGVEIDAGTDPLSDRSFPAARVPAVPPGLVLLAVLGLVGIAVGRLQPLR